MANGDAFTDYLSGSGWGSLSPAVGQMATFMDFLETDPWTQRYSQLPQYERGVTQTATNPRTRFIFY